MNGITALFYTLFKRQYNESGQLCLEIPEQPRAYLDHHC